MRFFAKSKTTAGWLAVTLEGGGAYAVLVQRTPGGRPAVELAAFFPGQPGNEVAVLEKLSRTLQIERHRCTTLLADGDYQLLSVEAPNVPPDELKMAIRWRLKDMLDFHVDDATIDVLTIPADKNAPTRNYSMYAAAARNQILQRRQTLFEQAKIPLSVIDLPELAQRNLAALAETEGRGLAMLSFGHDGGLLTITYSQELCLARRIDVAFEQLQHADEVQKAALLDRITLELQRSLDHVDRQFHFITLSKLLIAPLGEDDAGLRDYLSSNLYVPVDTFMLDSVVDLERAPELRQPEAQRRFLLTVGAALRYEETVP
jgi:MSHA biogenesis protein MshI